MRLSPVDPQRPGMQAAIAAAHFVAGRFDVGASLARPPCWSSLTIFWLLLWRLRPTR